MRPTKNISTISRRQEQIEKHINNRENAQEIAHILAGMLDIPKIVSLLLYKKHTPTTFGKLRYALSLLFADKTHVYEGVRDLGVDDEVLAQCEQLYRYLVELLKDEGLNDEIDYIKDGFDDQIDELRKIAYHSDELLITYQQDIVNYSKVANVKVKYISNQ